MVRVSGLNPSYVPLVCLDVQPCGSYSYNNNNNDGQDEEEESTTTTTAGMEPSFLGAAVKVFLLNWTCQVALFSSTKTTTAAGKEQQATDQNQRAKQQPRQQRPFCLQIQVESNTCRTRSSDNHLPPHPRIPAASIIQKGPIRFTAAVAAAAGTTTASSSTPTTTTSSSTGEESENDNILWLPQLNPNLAARWPCRCYGYIIQKSSSSSANDIPTVNSIADSRRIQQQKQPNLISVKITEDTLVRILPSSSSLLSSSLSHSFDFLTGERPKPIPLAAVTPIDYVNYDPETIRELAVRLQRLLVEPIWIGTTTTRKDHWHNSDSNDQWSVVPPQCMEFHRDAALLVEYSHAAQGKTTPWLVERVARDLGCQVVHVVQLGPLLSKYGSQADVALETILHDAVWSAALQQQTICIILDHVWSSLRQPATTTDMGDAALPVLSSMKAYLQTLVQHSLVSSAGDGAKTRFPFPRQNPLYNLHHHHHTRGEEEKHECLLPVRLCLVAVDPLLEQNNHNSNEEQQQQRMFRSIFRLRPWTTAATRVAALQHAMQKQGVMGMMSAELQSQFPSLAASAVWAHPEVHFPQIARQVQIIATGNDAAPVTVADFTRALYQVQTAQPRSITTTTAATTTVQVLLAATAKQQQPEETKEPSSLSTSSELDGWVGGQAEAKAALEEALALHPQQQQWLSFFEIKAPTGVLLYGPPGCGKTLLAKAVAQTMKKKTTTTAAKNHSDDGTGSGGAFVAIQTTDIARAQVGTGEKLLVAAFENARANAPAVIFLDEFQALFTARSSGGNSSSSRLTSTLLTAMDDCQTWSRLKQQQQEQPGPNGSKGQQQQHRIVILAATNTPWMIDSAFLRPGRFDRIVHVGLPTLEERVVILQQTMRRMKLKMTTTTTTAPTTKSQEDEQFWSLCRELAQATVGYSGADLTELCRSAAVVCLLHHPLRNNKHDNNNDKGNTTAAAGVMVEPAHFWQALQDSEPSSDPELVEQLESWSVVTGGGNPK